MSTNHGEPCADAVKARLLFSYDAETGLLYRAQPAHGGRWKAGVPVGGINACGYRTTQFNGKRHYVHRVIWLLVYGHWPSDQIDHIDRDKSNNRLANLRAVTPAANRQNMPRLRSNTSGQSGVWWCKQRKKWLSVIWLDNVRHYVGAFDSLETAGDAWRLAKRRLHPNWTE